MLLVLIIITIIIHVKVIFWLYACGTSTPLPLLNEALLDTNMWDNFKVL